MVIVLGRGANFVDGINNTATRPNCSLVVSCSISIKFDYLTAFRKTQHVYSTTAYLVFASTYGKIADCPCSFLLSLELALHIVIFNDIIHSNNYQKFLLCISSQGQDLYSHQKLNMYIYWFSFESGY